MTEKNSIQRLLGRVSIELGRKTGLKIELEGLSVMLGIEAIDAAIPIIQSVVSS